MTNEKKIQLDNCTIFLPADKLRRILIESYEDMETLVEQLEKKNRHLERRLEQNGIISWLVRRLAWMGQCRWLLHGVYRMKDEIPPSVVIRFKNLSGALKTLVVFGWITLVFYIIAFIAGFIMGFYGI